MKNVHPLRTGRRKQRRLQALGSDNPFCLLCGCTEPMLLRPVTRRFLEQHHVVGRAVDKALVLALCFNCHALVTEGLAQAGVSMKRESNPIKFAVQIFRALAVHFEMLRDACWRFATLLETSCHSK